MLRNKFEKKVGRRIPSAQIKESKLREEMDQTDLSCLNLHCY